MRLAVIGAGPGGLYAALAAAKRGLRVDLFEKRRIGDGVVCGECIFDSLGIMTRPGRGLLHDVNEIVLRSRRTYHLPVSPYRRLWMVDRTVWQRGLAEEAVVSGVAIHEREPVSVGMLHEMKGAYDWVIDAGGAPSVTSRAYGFSSDYFQRYMLAYQVVLRGDFSGLIPAIKAGFLPTMPRDVMPGYYWVFPRNADTANVGVGGTAWRGGRFRVDLKALLPMVMEREGLAGMTVLRRGGGLIPARIHPRLLYDNILLVGDAAGVTSSLHGGGIDLACLSGILAVEAIVKGRQGVENYRNRLMTCLQEKLTMETLMIGKMRHLSFKEFDDILHATAERGAFIRTKIALRHPDLLLAVWKWLRRKLDVKTRITCEDL
jgi:digeranylgeranylglycerophospholipid reductase